jgi:hypothetical protein
MGADCKSVGLRLPRFESWTCHQRLGGFCGGCVNDQGAPVLYAIVTGATVARDVGKLVDLAHRDGWDVCVIASPNGCRFIDVDAVAAKTGRPVRCQYKELDAPDVLPPADAMIAAPITSNSLAKWGAGISDTLPLGLLVEAVGLPTQSCMWRPPGQPQSSTAARRSWLADTG